MGRYRPSSLKPSHVVRTIATGVTQSAAAIGAGALGTLAAGPVGGAAAMTGVTFAQLYGDTVKDYREAMEGESDELVKGMAFLSAAGQSAIETVLGPERVLAGIGKGFFSGALKQTTRSLAKRIGVNAARGALEEGSEEVCQLYWDMICKGVYAKKGIELPGWEEVKDNFMGGALPGAVLSGVAGGAGKYETGNMKYETGAEPGANAVNGQETQKTETGVPQETPTPTAEAVQPEPSSAESSAEPVQAEQPQMEAVQPEQAETRPLFDGREPVSLDELENVPSQGKYEIGNMKYEMGDETAEGYQKNVKRYSDYIEQREREGLLHLNAGQKEVLMRFYESFPLGQEVTNRFGEKIKFSPLDASKVDDYIQHFAVKRGGGKESFSRHHLALFDTLAETLQNPDERILTETKKGDRRICFIKRLNEKGNHFVVTAISENGHLLAWTHMQSSDQYIETQRKNEKECFNKYGVVDRDGNRLGITYDEYLKLKTDMPLYLATAQTNRESLSQMTIPDGSDTVQPEAGKSRAGTEKIAENIPGRSLRADETGLDEFAELNRKLATAYEEGKAPQVIPAQKPLSKGQKAVKQIMQDLFGKEVVYYDASGAEAPDGMSNTGDGKIYLNSKGSKPLLFTAFHEFYHEVRGTEEGKAIAEVMRKAVKPEVYESWKAKYNQDNQKLGINQLNEDDLFEEFCSDSLGTFSGRESFWKELASEQPGIVQRFLEWLAELKNMVVSRYAEEKVKSVIADIDRAEKQVATILKKETARHQKTRAVDGSMHVQRVKTGEIAADPARFQFKGDVDAEGVAQNKALGGQWDDKSAGVLYLWEDKNGRKFVVNGHHRLALANRLNVPEVNAIIDREADGVTAEQARRNGALQNIRQGQGTVLDYANFIRQEGMGEEEAGKEGLLSREEGRTGYLIGHYASDNLMDFFRNGDITAAKAAAIASVAHGDANLERVGLHLQKGMSADALMQTLKLAQNELKNNAVQADDLFGDSGDAALREWEELGKRAQKKQDEIARDIKAIQNAVRNPETAKKGGVDVREKAKKNLERLKREQQRWKNWHTDAELIATIAGTAGNGKYEIGNMKYEMGAEPGSETAVNGQETQKAKPKKEKPAEPAAEAKAEPEAKVAEKAEMPKTEETATAKTPEIVKINTVSEITDEDFQKPYRSLELPSLPERTLKAMGKEAKPVLLKQNILEKNRNHHPELSEKDSRETLQKALYENDLVGQSQPSKRPNYWVAVQLSSGKNAVAVLDITETKTHHEIVGWRIINDKSLQALKNQAVREGGQILTSQDDNLRASSDHTEPGNLSNTVTPEAEKSSETVAKVDEKAETKDGQPRPDLHDYLDANVDMSAEVEFSEDEEDGEQGDAGKVKMSKPDEDVRGSYSLQNAVASKHGYDVEHVNENAGHELNEAKGVIAEPGKIYQRGDVPKLQPVGWIKKRCISYARQNGIIGEHSTPCLGDGVNVSVGGIRSIANHSGSDIKNNLIAYIPELLKNAVLIQTETNRMSRTHLIAAKVRYSNERFVVGMIIHENAGKFYYDHELVEIENADRYSLPASTSGVGNKSASTINVIQNALMSSGFEKNNPKNLKFSKPAAEEDAEYFAALKEAEGEDLAKKLKEAGSEEEREKIFSEWQDEYEMSKPWTGEKEEYPAEWGKCFSQYRGKKYLAVQHLLHRKEGFVPAAFHREDIGDIDIVYGETGEGVEDKRGYGLAHIRKRHPGMDWKLFSQVIQTGELKEINDRRVNIVDGKAKVIIELEWKGQERKWVVSAMGGDLTSTADSLLASNPQEAAKQGIAPKGMVTIGDLWEKSSQKSGKFTENDGGTIKFSIRREEPPKKTRTGYKVFAMFKSHPGELFPPMVANPGGASTPVGVWLNADAAPRAEDSKTGRPRVQSGGKGTNAGKATLAYRPGWHLGPLPEASQFLVKNPETGEAKSMFPENFVFAECEFAADEDYQQEAMSYGYNASGKFQHSLAGLPKVPKDGYYVYRTNPDPKTVPWYISGAMRVKRLLNDRETAEILRENGSRMVPRRGGELDLKAWGFDRTDFTGTDGVKYSLARTEQRNPIEVGGEARRENQEKLDNEEHEVHHDADVLAEAKAEIDAHGGIGKVIEKVLNGRKLFTPDDVGQRMGQLVMNSDEYGKLSAAERSMVSDAVIQVGTQLGQALRSRRSLTEAMMSDPDALKSTLRLITDRTPDADKTREHVKEKTGVDPLNPPDNLNNDKDKLDQVLRELSAGGANLQDKIYEYWINAILSGPQTHAVNVIGNTANAAYELTAKRFAEACINLIAKKKDGATFGEFREMWKHLSEVPDEKIYFLVFFA